MGPSKRRGREEYQAEECEESAGGSHVTRGHEKLSTQEGFVDEQTGKWRRVLLSYESDAQGEPGYGIGVWEADARGNSGRGGVKEQVRRSGARSSDRRVRVAEGAAGKGRTYAGIAVDRRRDGRV